VSIVTRTTGGAGASPPQPANASIPAPSRAARVVDRMAWERALGRGMGRDVTFGSGTGNDSGRK
jgi:hypothetical protein